MRKWECRIFLPAKTRDFSKKLFGICPNYFENSSLWKYTKTLRFLSLKKSLFQSTSLYSEPLSACLTSDASSGPELILTLSSCTFRTTQTWFCTVDNVSSYSEMKLPLEIYEYSNHSSSHPSSFYRCFLKTIWERQIESSIPSQDKTRGDKVNRRARSSPFWPDIHLALVDLCSSLSNNWKRWYYFIALLG